MDGANPLRTVVSVILPPARPGLFTAGVFATWAEFLMALTDSHSHPYRPITARTT